MKRTAVFLLFLTFGIVSLLAQTIDRSQYEETNSEDLAWWGDTNPRNTRKQFKMYIEFLDSSGTTYEFRETQGRIRAYYKVSKRWNLTVGQKYMVYFTAIAPAPSGNSDYRIIDDIDLADIIISKPWLPFISNGKTGLHGWYLEDLGNGTYREVYFE